MAHIARFLNDPLYTLAQLRRYLSAAVEDAGYSARGSAGAPRNIDNREFVIADRTVLSGWLSLLRIFHPYSGIDRVSFV
jgi:hypothetical protein